MVTPMRPAHDDRTNAGQDVMWRREPATVAPACRTVHDGRKGAGRDMDGDANCSRH